MRSLRATAPVALLVALAGCAPTDHRTTDTSRVDINLEREAISRINSRRIEDVHVNVTMFNRHALLTGEVPSGPVKAEVAQIVSGMQGVQGVSNELVVGEMRGIRSQSADSLTNSDVKLRLAKSSLGVGRVKVVTEAGTVFLMGLVSRQEAREAADLASTTKGVARVIMLFEYQD